MQSISRIREPHLKHERAHRNRSFARLVFWLTRDSSLFPALFTSQTVVRIVTQSAAAFALLDEPLWFFLRAEPKREYLAAISLRKICDLASARGV
jgi:hypothetical protein